MGIVKKKSGVFRMITDCSEPDGLSVNQFMGEIFVPFTFITIEEIYKNLPMGTWLSSIDLRAAYKLT